MTGSFICCLLSPAVLLLAVFFLPVTKGQAYCRYNHPCYICRFPRPPSGRDNCIVFRYCFNKQRGSNNPLCLQYAKTKEETRSCGIHPTRNIVGGSPSNEGDWPWQVSLQTRDFGHICGGVLIDSHWVLTASHCVYRSKSQDLIVVVGEFDLKRRSGKEQMRRVKKIFVHPFFRSGGNYPYDAALLRLENDVHYNEFVTPVCLPGTNDFYAPNSCYITGWGETRGTGNKYRLRVLPVYLLSSRVCERYWSGAIRSNLHICVNNGLKGACSGDSGGPLSCIRKSDGRFVVAGVTSWGDRSCHRLGFPSVYTNIQTFVPWINYIMKSND